MTMTEALSTPVEKRTYFHQYRGQWYDNRQLASLGGIQVKTFLDRVLSGWSVEEAVETPLNVTHKSWELEWEGRKWSLTALASHLGLSPSSMRRRVIAENWTLNEI
jgi:hypothetical protein